MLVVRCHVLRTAGLSIMSSSSFVMMVGSHEASGYVLSVQL
jgi:hypothetical protein